MNSASLSPSVALRESFPDPVVLQLPERLTQSLRVHWMIVAQIVVCAAPSMILLAVQQVRLASLAFYGPLAVLLAYHGLCGRTVRATAVVVGVMPLLAMMRGTLFHNSVAVILAMMIVHWFVFKNGDFLRMANNAMILGLLLASFGYWGASFLSTGLYHQNMRVFDLVFAAVLVSLLGHHRDYLASAFAGLAIAVVCVAIAVGISGGDRLGLTEIGDFSIGSPEQLAIPCVLVIILCFADEGRWILPGIPTVCRYLLSGVVASILLMTTSRTNWSLVLVAVLLLFFLQAGSRRQIFAGVVVLIIAVAILLTTSRGETVKRYFFKVASTERTLSQKTTYRFDQYSAFPELLATSPWLGHGPGSAQSTYSRRDGYALVFHSMYLHIGIETGLIGLGVLLLYGLVLLIACCCYYGTLKETVPLVAYVCFLVEGLANNNFNPLIGIFLGVSLVATSASVYRRLRTVPIQSTSDYVV